jgi:hypothetical protein
MSLLETAKDWSLFREALGLLMRSKAACRWPRCHRND